MTPCDLRQLLADLRLTSARAALATLTNAWIRCPCGDDVFVYAGRGTHARAFASDEVLRTGQYYYIFRCRHCAQEYVLTTAARIFWHGAFEMRAVTS